jgi:RimJ/RimL family protein N-acetyltransferase
MLPQWRTPLSDMAGFPAETPNRSVAVKPITSNPRRDISHPGFLPDRSPSRDREGLLLVRGAYDSAMTISFRPITIKDARDIAAWRYPAPYDFYNLPEDDDPAELLEPAAGAVIAVDEHGETIGFAAFGFAGQVPGGEAAGLYREPLLDIGLGMRPGLTGRGFGATFCQAILDYAEVCYRPAGFRLSVARFNQRAIRVYERLGFVRGEQFSSEVRGETVEFVLMRRWNMCSPEPNEAFRT